MAALKGFADPETRRGGRLCIDHPVTTKTLAALSLAEPDLAEIRQFSNRLAREADAWMRRGGFSERSRIRKADANRMFYAAFGSAVRT